MLRTSTLAVIVTSSLISSSAFAKTYYTKSNLHLHKNKISAINYQTGSLLPLGTKVFILKRNGGDYLLKANGMRFSFHNHRSTGMRMHDAFETYFGDDPTAELKALSKKDRKLAKRGKLAIGMSKKAVLLSVGRPPPHKTPSTQSHEWFYWKSKMSTFRVVFDEDDKVELIDDGKKKKSGGLFSGLFKSDGKEKPKDIRYAKANVHTHDGVVSWVNYLTGPVIKLGTKVEVTDIDDDEVEFRIAKSGKAFSFENDESRSGHTAIELFERMFSKEDPKKQIGELPKKDRRRVRAARPRLGMSKEAVLMAIGPPPPHKTPSTESDEWTYWKNRFRKMKVVFNDDGRVETIK